MIIILILTATGIPNGDAAAQAALQQAYPTIPYPGIGKYISALCKFNNFTNVMQFRIPIIYLSWIINLKLCYFLLYQVAPYLVLKDVISSFITCLRNLGTLN